jgi:sialate O-acetylesterase
MGRVATHTFNSTTPAFTCYTADLSDEVFQGRSGLTFRIYVNSVSGSSQIYLRINSIALIGKVVPGTASKTSVDEWPAERIAESLNNPRPILSVAPLFTDNAVLQRGTELPVWGKSKPGKTITVRFAGQSVSAPAAGDGKWAVTLDPLQAEKTGMDFIVESELGQIVLTNVVVGEVWLCSGQSNMEWPLKHDPQAEKRIAESDVPLIRQFKVKNSSLEEPSDEANGAWIPCSPETARDFTAVGYYFARDLQPKLDVPIGLINSSWGATSIEAWMSSGALDPFPQVAEGWNRTLAVLPQKEIEYQHELVEYKRKAAEAKASGTEFNWRKYPKPPAGPGTREAPSGPYNGMIAPLIPYSIAGILWYQGESNCGSSGTYAELFPAHIQDLRRRWNNENMPFYFVQLPNYEWTYDRSGVKWATFRDAQMEALALPKVGAAIIIDGPTPEEGHPPDKGSVGARLARLAEVLHYGIAEGDAAGPLCRSAVFKNGIVELAFDQASSGLKVKGDSLTGFELAGADGTFVEAQARIEGDHVLVSANGIIVPAEVRYAWRNNPEVSLYNGAGLPASPFTRAVE